MPAAIATLLNILHLQANSIVSVANVVDIAPGAHTLKVGSLDLISSMHSSSPRYHKIWMVEPTVIVQKIVISKNSWSMSVFILSEQVLSRYRWCFNKLPWSSGKHQSLKREDSTGHSMNIKVLNYIQWQ